MSGKLFRRIFAIPKYYKTYTLRSNNLNITNLRMMASGFQTEEGMGNQMITMEMHKQQLAQKMGINTGFSVIPKSREHLSEYLPKSQDELPPRTMEDSYTEGIIPLSSDKILQDKYVTFLGSVRLGRLLEDMDLFSVVVAHKHLKIPHEGKHSPYSIVTAFVDNIHFSDYKTKATEDIRIKGYVSWVGRTSLEATVWLEQHAHGAWQNITKAYFILAARDPTNARSAFVNPLVSSTDEEKAAYEAALVRKKKRAGLQKLRVSKVVPTSEEQNLIHDLYLKTIPVSDLNLQKRVLPTGGVWMSQHTLSNLIFSHPENRNLYNKVFGGFIMRNALELSWGCCYLFTKSFPVLKCINNIDFKSPVEVNSMIRMRSYVVYTYNKFIQITIYVDMWDANFGKSGTTNVFNFTYEVENFVPQVYPNTYHEAMMYIDGKRNIHDVFVETENSWYEPKLSSKM